jgi:glutathione S-transferase
MRLYYSAGSCSTSCHISLEESGLKYEAIPIDWEKSNDPNVTLVEKLNPLGTLPIMILDDNRALTQNVAIHTYIAEKAPHKNLLPAAGTTERAEALNWLSFVAADLHKSFSPLFATESFSSDPRLQEMFRNWNTAIVLKYLKYLDQNLSSREYLTGNAFTVADSYCFVVSNWARYINLPVGDLKNLQAYLERVSQRPAVQKVLREEGLLDESAA